YPAHCCDIVACHFLLRWRPDPQRALQEMLRVSRTSGQIIAFAEPDYSRRIDEPEIFSRLGDWQADALRKQGADPDLGGKLAELFDQAGIQIVETGVISRSTSEAPKPAAWELEWAVIESDLAGTLPAENIQVLKELDRQAWQSGQRKLYVPTHYAWGNRKRQ
ncbi:MAG: hypothetical protein L3J16_05320, partial [Anaerolineales bacterium]|nr:hypothetical protein [Anaerolineales bacterium]